MLQLVEQEFHGIDRAHGRQDAAQDPHLGEHAFVDQQFFLACTRLGDIDGRERRSRDRRKAATDKYLH